MKPLTELPKSAPDGLRIDGRGYLEFRKQYKAKTIFRSFGRATDEGYKKSVPVVLGLLADIAAGKYDFDEEQRITVSEACDIDWQLHGAKADSVFMFKTAYKVMKQEWGSRWYDTLSSEDVEELREKAVEEGILARYHNGELQVLPTTEANANRYQTVISGMYNRLKLWSARGVIRKIKLPELNPCYGVKKTHEEARTRVLSEEEYERLLATSTPRVRAICEAAVMTLLRRKDLEFPLKGTWDERTHIYTATQNKTNKIVQIPMAAPVPEGLDFTNFRNEFEEAVKKANIRDFLFMDLRRTGATWLHKSGVPGSDLKTISLYLGHKSVTTTERYLGLVSKDLKAASNFLAEKVRKASVAANELNKERV